MFNLNILTGLIAVLPISLYCIYLLKKKNDKKNDCTINEVYWTNCLSNNCDSKDCKLNYCTLYKNNELIKLINNAKHSIDLAMHIFTSLEMSDAILQAHKRNVRVRIVCCNLQKASTGSQVWQLFDEGVEVRFQKASGEILMHHKFCIIDGKNRVEHLNRNNKTKVKPNSVLISGSCNWTRQGLYTNWENIIVTNDAKLMSCFEKEFELIWSTFRVQ